VKRTNTTTSDEADAPVPLERLYTKMEAAEALNVSPRFMDRCVVERRIRFVRVGRHIRIPASALTEFVDRRTVQPVP
jgi:excisionase family DNA binding protein